MSTAGIVLAITIVVFSGFSGDSIEREQRAQQESYCEMVGLYVESNGEYGWPDYKGNAKEVCK